MTLYEQQFAFTAQIRSTEGNCVKSFAHQSEIDPRRATIYRDLVFSNLDSLLSGNFPIIRKMHSTAQWQSLVREFLRDHRCQTPLFTELGFEFVQFLQQRQPKPEDPKWLSELAHYEWVELALYIADDIEPVCEQHGDLLTGIIVMSPFAWPLAYRWPVHRIGPQNTLEQQPPELTLLLARRTTEGIIVFSELSPSVYHLLELFSNNTHRLTGSDALRLLSKEVRPADLEEFLRMGTDILQKLHAQRVIVGTLSA